ncbi:MAG: sulfide/dihydroorotate dehydrogenase-like FAD/NAD-binding protein [Candidatus Humimicrobiaceae bacterium]
MIDLYRIEEKEELAQDIDMFRVKAPLVAKKAKAGQFVVVRIYEEGERIPLTIADFDRDNGLITLVSMKVGKTTAMLSRLGKGDLILDVVGPLGNPSEIDNFGRVVLVGGGVGIAPIMPIARALKEKGNHVISVIGSKSKDYLIFEKEMEEISHELYVCTDDGSKGFKGFVSEFLDSYLKKNITVKQGKKTNISRVIAIGPSPMMAAVSKVTEPLGVVGGLLDDGTGLRHPVGHPPFHVVAGAVHDGHRSRTTRRERCKGTHVFVRGVRKLPCAL